MHEYEQKVIYKLATEYGEDHFYQPPPDYEAPEAIADSTSSRDIEQFKRMLASQRKTHSSDLTSISSVFDKCLANMV
jgi:hypothetical protein